MNNYCFALKRPLAKYKIFIFHHAGGNLGAYRSWSNAFGELVETTIIELPGRGRSFNQPLLQSYAEAVNFLTQAVGHHLDGREFAILGHSMGAVLSLGVAAELEQRGEKLKMLFISGIASPKWMAEKPVQVDSTLPAESFLAGVQELGGFDQRIVENAELLEIFLPILKADYKIVESFDPHGFKMLETPIRALCGREDQVAEDIHNWQQYTSSNFKDRKFEGGHFYLNEWKDAICQYIESELLELSVGST